MAELKVGKKDIVWGFGAQFFQLGAGAFILPYVLHKLPPSQLAIWYIYLALMALVSLLDFGFSSTTTLNVSYIFSGATKLSPEGILAQEILDHPNMNLLRSLIATVKRIYRIVSVSAFLCLSVFGTIYLRGIADKSIPEDVLWVSWACIVVSTTFNLYFGYFNPLLTGSGKITSFRKITIATRVIYIAVSLLMLFFGFGLIGLAAANLTTVVFTRILSHRAFYSRDVRERMAAASDSQEDLFQVLWTNSKKAGVVSIGSFLIQKANVFFVAPFLPLEQTAKFGLAMQLIGFISGLSATVFYTMAPALNGYRVRNDTKMIERKFSIGLLSLFAVYMCAGLPLVLFGNDILGIVGSKTRLPEFWIVGMMLLAAFLESNHSISAGLITTNNTVPYVKPAIFSGALIVAATYFVLKYSNFGLLGVVGVQLFVQACYNNWKWPYEMLKDLDTNYPRLIILGCRVVREKVGLGGGG